MLGTSTHDTKRGEDARARLAVLSELPDQWAEQAAAWSRLLRPEGTAPEAGPDRNDEYALLQLLVGTCPVEFFGDAKPEAAALAAYAERVKGAMTKAMREAKVHTTWAMPDAAYEAATLAFVDAALTGDRAAAFWAAFLPFAGKVARLGASNSIVQTVLKLTMPGVPDLYQGTELWDLSMVDPDNRRPVDFFLRQRLLGELDRGLAADRAAAMADFAKHWPDGKVKLAVTSTILGWRRDHTRLFTEGGYEPIDAEGPQASDLCGFARQVEGAAMVVAVGAVPGPARNPALRRRDPPRAAVRARRPALDRPPDRAQLQ